MNFPVPLLARWSRFFRGLSIQTKTVAALTVLLSCFAILGANSYFTMSTTGNKLTVLRDQTLPLQTEVTEIANDIIATHMKVFRVVTLASNGVTHRFLDPLYAEVLAELDGETVRLAILAEGPYSFDAKTRELDLLTTKWLQYVTGVKDLLDVGRTDAPMAAMMLGALDEDFQRIAGHLGAMSSQVNAHTSSLASNLLSSVATNKQWLAYGGIVGMLISVLVAMAFARSLVRPIVSVTRAMQNVSSGMVDAEVQPGFQERGDEIGQMIDAIAAFRLTTRRHAQMIASQSQRFDAALNNMSHGLCMFDADSVLTVRNNRFLEIYGIPPGSIEPGCLLPEALQKLVAAGVLGADQDHHVYALRAAAAEGRSTRFLRHLQDGRSIQVSSQPMADGGWVATHEDVTERIGNEKRIAHIARHDTLTGLPNRLAFRERTEEALPKLRHGESVAILCIDLDDFKMVNDTFGHPGGDALLQMVADRLRQNVRECDIVARLGGDEFAVVQTAVHQPCEIDMLAKRIVEKLSAPYTINDQEVVVGASIGVAVAPDDGVDPDELLKKSDIALYRSKADGGRTVRFYEAQMDALIQARHKLETDLRRAVAQGEFVVYYQPIVDLQSNQVASFEALVRWNHPQRGLVMPDGFITMAEEIGLIAAIGESVLRQACAEAASWPRNVRIAVNLSPCQFTPALVPTVLQALQASGLGADRLELEITESVLLQDSETTMAILRELHALGVSISLDDFGTGYSSLSYLHSFPFDKIKIDRSFIRDLGTSSHCAAIVKAVTGLGRNLDIAVTAEGVETAEQLEWLRAASCTSVQGYFFSRPQAPAADMAGLIAALGDRAAANDGRGGAPAAGRPEQAELSMA